MIVLTEMGTGRLNLRRQPISAIDILSRGATVKLLSRPGEVTTLSGPSTRSPSRSRWKRKFSAVPSTRRDHPRSNCSPYRVARNVVSGASFPLLESQATTGPASEGTDDPGFPAKDPERVAAHNPKEVP